jgi:hypothetical protein
MIVRVGWKMINLGLKLVTTFFMKMYLIQNLKINILFPASTTLWLFQHQVPKHTIGHQKKINARIWDGLPTWINEYKVAH